VVLALSTASVAGLLLVAAWPSLLGAAAGRLLFGLGSATAGSVLMTWLVAVAPSGQRGRTLSVFGLSVWLGLALGPLFGESVNVHFGTPPVFVACAAAAVVCMALVAPLRSPVRARHPLPG